MKSIYKTKYETPEATFDLILIVTATNYTHAIFELIFTITAKDSVHVKRDAKQSGFGFGKSTKVQAQRQYGCCLG